MSDHGGMTNCDVVNAIRGPASGAATTPWRRLRTWSTGSEASLATCVMGPAAQPGGSY